MSCIIRCTYVLYDITSHDCINITSHLSCSISSSSECNLSCFIDPSVTESEHTVVLRQKSADHTVKCIKLASRHCNREDSARLLWNSISRSHPKHYHSGHLQRAHKLPAQNAAFRSS